MSRARLGALFWIALGAAASVGGWRLGIGAARATGPGLFPFALGAALVVLGVVSALRRDDETQAEAKAETEPASDAANAMDARKVLVPVSIAMVGYVIALQPLGFTVATFGFVGYLVKRTGASWKLALGWAIAVAVTFTVLFAALSLRLPRGVLAGLIP